MGIPRVWNSGNCVTPSVDGPPAVPVTAARAHHGHARTAILTRRADPAGLGWRRCRTGEQRPSRLGGCRMRQDIIDLYDEFTHRGLDRRVFMARLVELAGGTAAATSAL